MRPQPQRRTPIVKAAAASTMPIPQTSQQPRAQRRVITVKTETMTKPTQQLLSPPITPTTRENTPSRRQSPMTGTAASAAGYPRWMLKLQQIHNATLPGLSSKTFAIETRIYTEPQPILKLLISVRHKIFSLALDFESPAQTTLSTFGDYRQWAAPTVPRISPHFLEDLLPVYLHKVTLVVNRGEEFRVARLLSVGTVRTAVEKLDFPRSFLNSPTDLRILEIMRACPALREVTLDICVDHLLRPKLDAEGTKVSWESMPVIDVDERYSFDVIARLTTLAVLKYRLVGECYGWERQF